MQTVICTISDTSVNSGMLETKLSEKEMIRLPGDYKTARKMMCSNGDFINEFTK